MYFDEFKHQLPDIDPDETDDWMASGETVDGPTIKNAAPQSRPTPAIRAKMKLRFIAEPRSRRMFAGRCCDVGPETTIYRHCVAGRAAKAAAPCILPGPERILRWLS